MVGGRTRCFVCHVMWTPGNINDKRYYFMKMRTIGVQVKKVQKQLYRRRDTMDDPEGLNFTVMGKGVGVVKVRRACRR